MLLWLFLAALVNRETAYVHTSGLPTCANQLRRSGKYFQAKKKMGEVKSVKMDNWTTDTNTLFADGKLRTDNFLR